MDTQLANRLRKRYRHLRKWARRTDVTCFRIYERDIPEYPLIVDWYDGEAVVWLYQRKRDETPAEAQRWAEESLAQVQQGLDLSAAQIFVKERQVQRGNEQYDRFGQDSHVRTIAEQGLAFEVNLSDYLDTGLFLDHRNTRARVREEAKGKRLLNLFAYTGSFTCYAIDGGAKSTTTVDLSQTYCDWARRNLHHNGFEESDLHQVIQADCLAYLKEAKQRREQYDIIICDPPTFSNSKRMDQGSFDVARDQAALIRDCLSLLAKNGLLYFSTNARGFKLDESGLPPNTSYDELTPDSIPEDFRNRNIHRCWLFTISS